MAYRREQRGRRSQFDRGTVRIQPSSTSSPLLQPTLAFLVTTSSRLGNSDIT